MSTTRDELDKNQPSPKLIAFRNNGVALVFSFCIIGFLGSFFLSQIFAWNEVGHVRDRLDQTVQERRDNQAKVDCRNLYTGDLIMALGISQLANNNMWMSVGSRESGLTEEEQVALNNALVEELAGSNVPLEEAVAALSAYTAMDPKPEVCPHPQSISNEIRQSVGGD